MAVIFLLAFGKIETLFFLQLKCSKQAWIVVTRYAECTQWPDWAIGGFHW